MSQDKPSIIERSSHDAFVWLHQIADGLNRDDDLRSAYHALRAVLHTLRDTLAPDEAMDLASQLPTLIRGIYFEGYHLADKPVVHRGRQDFVLAVDALLTGEGSYTVDPERCVMVVFDTLSEHLSEGQVVHARGMLHKEVQELWREDAFAHR